MSGPLVLVDADVLGRERTGDETYIENLLRELGRLELPFRLAAVARRAELVPPGVEALEVRTGSQTVRMGIRLPLLFGRLRPRVVHFQYMLPPRSPAGSVVTVHDLSYELFPGLMHPRKRAIFRALVPRSVRRAAVVVTGSERTKTDLLERYGLPEGKVVIIPDGVDPVFGPEGPRREGPPYVLSVGSIGRRKDPLVALEAVARLDGLRLVLAGPDRGLREQVRAEAERLGIAERVTLAGYVPKEELAALYRGAACLVFPSRYEGFGLPAVEAMASGIPVVASTAGSLPEVVGDAGVLVEPGEPEALAAGIERALAERERLVAAGFERAARFTWAETARQTLAVYEGLL